VPARLFGRIQSLFSRLNKTALLIAVVLFAAIAIHSTPAFAQSVNTIKAEYSAWFDLFDPTGGITDIGVQKSTTNNDAVGLTLSLNLKLQPSNGESLDNAWGRIASHTSDIFVAELCLDSDPNRCWLTGLPFTDGKADGNNIIFKKAPSGETTSGEIVTVTAFSNTSGYTDTSTTSGGVSSVGVSVTPTSSPTTNGGDLHTYNPKTNIASEIGNLVLPKGESLSATLWYCADGDAKNTVRDDYTPNKIPITNPRTFGSLCSGRSYFQIGGTKSITIATDAAGLQQQVQAGQTAAATKSITTSTEDNNLPKCGLNVFGLGGGSINGCAARIAYGIYYLAELIAALFGQLFDFFIGYSVTSSSYTYGFAVTGWKLVRDISNIFFIIIMVWTGFSAVFDTSNTSMKKVVPALIINALLINFSLFATRVVIDISNITARMFYSQMLVCENVNKDPTSGKCIPGKTKTGAGGYWPLSEAIIGAFNPQKIFQASVLQQSLTVPGDSASNFDAQNVNLNKTKLSETDSANYFAAICLIGAFIMIVVAIMFFKVTFLFVGRVVGLYVCMIFSPFAFLSRDIPMLGGIDRLRWTDWLKELTNYALLAPIFIFFLYIIYTLLSSNFAQEIATTILSPGSTNVFELIISTAVPMAIIYFLMQAAQKAAEKYAGEIGKSIQGFGAQITGLALGAATGGAALMGGRVIGGLAKKADESTIGVGIRNLASKKGLAGWTGRKLQQGVNATRSGSFDLRQTSVGQGFFKQLGVNTDQKALNALSGVGLGLGVDQRKGGLEADIKRRQEDREKQDKLLEEKMTDDQIKAYNETKAKKREKKIDDIADKELLTKRNITTKQLKEWKKNNKASYDAEKIIVLSDPRIKQVIDAIPPATEIKSASELTNGRRKEFTENLKKEGLTTKGLNWLASKGMAGEIAATVLGAATSLTSLAGGSQVQGEGDRKAAKKIEERAKISQDLEKINTTLKKGFQDMIGLEMFQTSAGFTALHADEKRDIVKYGVIQATTNNGVNKGKSMYDVLSDQEKAAVDAERKRINTKVSDPDQEKVRKEELRQYEELVKVREQSKYNIKDINGDLTRKQKDWADDAGNMTKKKLFMDQLKEKERAETHLKTWQNINKHIEEQRKKLTDEGK
jgi:hypothetical protein